VTNYFQRCSLHAPCACMRTYVILQTCVVDRTVRTLSPSSCPARPDRVQLAEQLPVLGYLLQTCYKCSTVAHALFV